MILDIQEFLKESEHDNINLKVLDDRILKKYNENDILEDTLGLEFEKNINVIERKQDGQFYTPLEIVNYILNFLNVKKNETILDPTCGCGVFLSSAYNHLSKINKSPLKYIYGVDLNKNALKITKLNLYLKDKQSIKDINNNIKFGNSIISNKNNDKFAFDWNLEFKTILEKGGFNYIIGNPPYVTLKEGNDYFKSESNYNEIVKGNTNACSLLIAKSFELLKDKGTLAFVLPKTLLRVKSYEKLRNFILDKFNILHIYDLKDYFQDVRGEQIILFLEKDLNKNKELNRKILIKNFINKKKSLKEQKEFFIDESYFKEYNSFLVLENKKQYNLINKIKSNCLNLGSISEIFRGLNVKSENICNNSNYDFLIKGKNIQKFNLNLNTYVNKKLIEKQENKINLLMNDKIIFQNIFSSEAGLIGTIDYNQYLTLDTVTNIILKNDKLNIKYIFGILNSKLLNYFLIRSIFHNSKLTMHTDKVYLEKLPIKKVSKLTEKKVIKTVDELLNNKGNIKHLLKELDTQIYSIYNLNNSDIKEVEKSISEIFSKKSLW